MSMYRRPVVLVGIDGSPQSMAAARWAAEEAARRRQSLKLLHSTYLPIIGSPASGYPANFTEYVLAQGRMLLDQAVQDVIEGHPDLEVSAVLARSDPRDDLVEASGDVAMTVVGSLGSGRVREVLLGSVALHVAAHANSPVAVVPFNADARQGPVLVGVDSHANCEAAIGFAFDEASVRGVELVALMALDSWAGTGFAHRPTFDATESPVERAVLSEQLAGWAEKYPDVPVHEYLFRGRAAECLLGYAGHSPLAEQPQLIVVGSRGRGGLAGFVLGSTGHSVITHAACPVVVVRSLVR